MIPVSLKPAARPLRVKLFWYALLYVFSSFAIILTMKTRLAALLLLSFKDHVVALPHGAMCWSAVCDCGIF